MKRSSKGMFWFRFIGKHCFIPGSIDCLIPARFRCWDSERGGGGGGGGGGGVIPRAYLEWAMPA